MAQFRTPYVALRNLPYSFESECVGGGLCSGGVLRRGETVWAEEGCKRKTMATVTAYLGGQGLIMLNPTYLVGADLLREPEGIGVVDRRLAEDLEPALNGSLRAMTNRANAAPTC